MSIINDVLVDKLFKDPPKRTKEIPLLSEKTVSGDSMIVIKDAYPDSHLKNLTLYGKSQQDSTTGKNLWNAESNIEVDSFREVILNSEIPAGVYSISAIVNSDDTDSTDNLLMFYDKNSNKVGQITLRRGERNGRKVIFEKDVRKAYFYAGTSFENSKGDKATFADFQIEKGDKATPYEPYTGGKPSPSPEYPQEIKNVGDKGNVGVAVTGKNLLPNIVLPDKTDKGITWTYKSDGVYHVSGTSTGYFDSPILRLTDFNLPPGTYRMIDSKNAIPQIVIRRNSTGVNEYVNSKFVLEEGDELQYWYCIVLSEKTVDTDVYAYLELDTGFQPTKEDFEPYKPPQTLTLLTPNGLPGIKVESGGNYTDENGQQWVCDEIDSERRKYVQRIIKNILDGSELWYTWGANPNGNIGFYYYLNHYQSMKISSGECISNYLPLERETWNGEAIGVYISGSDDAVDLIYIAVSLKQSDLTDVSTNEMAIKSFREFLKSKKDSGIPFEIYCKLMEPIETDLPTEVIEQYKKLKTYYPTTVITADGGELPVGIEVTYMKPEYIPTKQSALRMWFKENPII